MSPSESDLLWPEVGAPQNTESSQCQTRQLGALFARGMNTRRSSELLRSDARKLVRELPRLLALTDLVRVPGQLVGEVDQYLA